MSILTALISWKKRDIDDRNQGYYLQSTHGCPLPELLGKLLELLLQILPLLNDVQTLIKQMSGLTMVAVCWTGVCLL